jgi:hypothetical protein
MYSIAQQAVANGYGNNEYFRAQPTALSSRVRTTVSAKRFSEPILDSGKELPVCITSTSSALSQIAVSNHKNVTTLPRLKQRLGFDADDVWKKLIFEDICRGQSRPKS